MSQLHLILETPQLHPAHPQLAIHRRQLPLAPAFEVTIVPLQGGEEEALEVDVNMSNKCSPQTSYVALSRATTREGIRIMRPFPLATYRGKSPWDLLFCSRFLNMMLALKIKVGDAGICMPHDLSQDRVQRHNIAMRLGVVQGPPRSQR